MKSVSSEVLEITKKNRKEDLNVMQAMQDRHLQDGDWQDKTSLDAFI